MYFAAHTFGQSRYHILEFLHHIIKAFRQRFQLIQINPPITPDHHDIRPQVGEFAEHAPVQTRSRSQGPVHDRELDFATRDPQTRQPLGGRRVSEPVRPASVLRRAEQNRRLGARAAFRAAQPQRTRRPERTLGCDVDRPQ